MALLPAVIFGRAFLCLPKQYVCSFSLSPLRQRCISIFDELSRGWAVTLLLCVFCINQDNTLKAIKEKRSLCSLILKETLSLMLNIAVMTLRIQYMSCNSTKILLLYSHIYEQTKMCLFFVCHWLAVSFFFSFLFKKLISRFSLLLRL